jgi:glycosyltransferase involved in cell wall biosynthesis
LRAPLVTWHRLGNLLGKRTYTIRLVLNQVIFFLSIINGKILSEFDVVVSFETIQSFLFALFGGSTIRNKLFYVYSSPSFPPGKFMGLSQRRLVKIAEDVTRIALRNMRCVICQNLELKSELLRLGIEARRIAVIPPGIEIDEWGELLDSNHFQRPTQKQDKIILFVGRINPQKGIEYAVQALSLLSKSRADLSLRLLIVGPDAFFDAWHESDYSKSLKALVKMHSLDERVQFLGAVTRKELGSLYRNADFVVVPSLSETYGLVVSEAMSFGKPVIGTDVEGIRMQIQNGKDGIIVPTRNPAAIASALEFLIDNPDEMKRISDNALASARTRTWSIVANRFLKAFEEIPPWTARSMKTDK